MNVGRKEEPGVEGWWRKTGRREERGVTVEEGFGVVTNLGAARRSVDGARVDVKAGCGWGV